MSAMFLRRASASGDPAERLPILIFFGVMAQLGILLNLGTSLIAAIRSASRFDGPLYGAPQPRAEGRDGPDRGRTRALRTSAC
jgi:hypothetical protein